MSTSQESSSLEWLKHLLRALGAVVITLKETCLAADTSSWHTSQWLKLLPKLRTNSSHWLINGLAHRWFRMIFVLNASVLHLMNKYVKQTWCLHPREQSMSYSHFKTCVLDLRDEERASCVSTNRKCSPVVRTWLLWAPLKKWVLLRTEGKKSDQGFSCTHLFIGVHNWI